MKRVLSVFEQHEPHWVGDGFPVRTLFAYSNHGAETSPFLLLDYAAAEFPPSPIPRGVGEHPHRGFETVTICSAGEIEHRDSGGHSGRIGPGDVQWMTAASGVVHEEMHSRRFTERGGKMEMAQLWVNLPAKHKMTAPRYQAILNADVPVVSPDGGESRIRVIAGSLWDTTGPAETFTPLNVWDVQMPAGAHLELPVPKGHTTTVAILKGDVGFGAGPLIEAARAASFDRDEETLFLEAPTGASLLVLTGEPIDEPIVGHGPFVMNTAEEIYQAVGDYRAGRMGHLS